MKKINFKVWEVEEKNMVTFPLSVASLIKDYLIGELNQEKHIILQFVGEKDKEGKEIFAGDIVMKQGRKGHGRDYYVVTWNITNQGWWLSRRYKCMCPPTLEVSKTIILLTGY